MSIHWYAHHLGDYAKKTQHLSMSEHGAYRLLLDHAYSVGGKILDDKKSIYRVCKAATPRERSTVDKILLEMFLHKEGFWTQNRVLEEIAKHCDISQKRKKAAAIAHANAHAKSHPTYNLQPQPTKDIPLSAPSSLPDSWNPTIDHENRCLSLGFSKSELAATFRNNYRAKGQKFADWDAAFDLWIDREIKFTKPRGGSNGQRRQKADTGTEAAERYIEKLARVDIGR